MKVQFIPGPMADERKKQAQSYILKRSIENLLKHKKEEMKPKEGA